MNEHTHQTHFAKGSFKAVCRYFLYNRSTEADHRSRSKIMEVEGRGKHGM